MNYTSHEQQVAEQLTAKNLPGLFEKLLSLKGHMINQYYTLRWLYAVGGQSILYIAENAEGQLVIIKIALLPYHRPAYMSIESIHQARQRLKKEANLLHDFQGTVLPKFYDLIYDVNPLHSQARGQEIFRQEPYLAMELIQGWTLIEAARVIHRMHRPDYKALEFLVWQVVLTATDFFISLSEKEDAFLYSDFNPRNVIISTEVDRCVRFLDAGSLIPMQEDPTIQVPFTPTYIPPEYYETYNQGKPLWPTPEYVMYTLGKGLWEILTNRQPYIAENPDLSEPKLKNYSSSVQNFIINLVERQFKSFHQLKQALDAEPTTKGPMKSDLFELLDASRKKTTIESIPKEDVLIEQRSNYTANLQLPQLHRNFSGPIPILRYSLDARYLAVASQNVVELWDENALHLIKSLKSPDPAPVVSLDFDATSKYLLTGNAKKAICLWDIDSNSIKWQHKDESFNGKVALNDKGNFLAAAIKWGAHTFNLQFTPPHEYHIAAPTDQGTCIAIAKQHSILAIGGLWRIGMWDIQKQLELGELAVGQDIQKQLKLGELAVGRDMYVHQVMFSQKGSIFAALCMNIDEKHFSKVEIWDTLSQKLLRQLEIPSQKVTCMSMDSEGQFIFAGSSEGVIWVWNQERVLSVKLTGQGKISSLDFSSNQRKLAIATQDGELRIYSLFL